jgi:glycosyltransferase involved in cell wall biosynthesis
MTTTKEKDYKTISLCLIVKDEEKVLKRCIDSMKGAYDELIIVDTGSADKTVEIAKELGARVEHFEWCDDFAKARNYSFSFATGDWIMWVDADDILKEGDAKRFRDIVHKYDHSEVVGLNFPYIYSHDSTGTGEMPGFKYHRLRIVKKETNPVWMARVHEYLKADGPHDQIDEVDFHHYREEGKGTQNTARNMRILKKVVKKAKGAEKSRYLFYYGKECMYNGLFDTAIEIFKQYIPMSNWLPEKHRAMYEMAVCYNKKGDFTQAKKWCCEAIKFDEDYVDPYVLLGKIAYEKEEWHRVIKWMIAATQCQAPKVGFFDFHPNHTYIPWDYMTMAYWHTGQYKKAYDGALMCLKYKPKDERYLHNEKEIKKKL